MRANVLYLLTVEYSLILATTPEHFKAVEDIRNDVMVNNYPEIKDTKEYIFNQDDRQSFIYLLQHQATRRYVGSVRIFFVNKYTPVQKIPMQKDLHIKDIEHFTQDLPIAEISRFALIKDQVPHKDFSELRVRTYLSLLLMSATRINVFLYDYSKLFAIMERSLHHILKRQSVLLKPIGDAIDFHGVRFPFVMKKEDFLIAGEKTEDTMGQLTRYYLKELCKNPEPLWRFIDNNPYLERSDMQLDQVCKFFKEYGEDTNLSVLLAEEQLETLA